MYKFLYNEYNKCKGGNIMAHSNDVATLLVSLRNTDELSGKYYSLSNLKLQKLLYFCHGLHFAVDQNTPLINENFEAWPYGPVIPTVYSRFSKYGQNDIPATEGNNFNLNLNEINTITQVWNVLKGQSAFNLVDATHVEGSPWHVIYNNPNEQVIPNNLIQEYFNQMGGL